MFGIFKRKLTVDSIVADIVLKAEQLEFVHEAAKKEADSLRAKASALILEASTTAHEADRALTVCQRLMALVEG